MKTLVWIMGGLILGAIIHIVSVLSLPTFADNDAWARLSRYGGFNAVYTLPAASPQLSAIADMDPSLRYAICRYDISQGPLRIDAGIPQTYWSLAIYDAAGNNYYSLNDRSAGQTSLTLWVADQAQILNMDPGDTEEKEDRLIIKSKTQYGVVIFRILVPGESYESLAREAFASTRCKLDNSIILPDE